MVSFEKRSPLQQFMDSASSPQTPIDSPDDSGKLPWDIIVPPDSNELDIIDYSQDSETDNGDVSE